MSADTINFFFTLREQVKLYHWQTHSYARHKATDELIDSLDKTMDEYVEVYMGKYGRPKMTAATATIKVSNLTEKTILAFLKKAILELEGPLVKRLDPKKDMDLFNLRDEMLGELNKLMYLFSLS
jgi:DNA-binding ferritin-like protein